MAVYLDQYGIEALFDGVNWTDITDDLVDEIRCFYGIAGAGFLDRVADSGFVTFVLNNTETNSASQVGYYTPGGVHVRTGFTIGLKVRLFLTYGGSKVIKFNGIVLADGIEIQTGVYSGRRVQVTAKDWMEQAYIYELISPEFAQNFSIGDVVAAILDGMPIQPDAVDYRAGVEIFPGVFDTARTATRAASEFFKVAISELGFIYHTRFGLKVEGRYTRNNEVMTPTLIPVSIGTSYILLEEGDYLLIDMPNLIEGDFLGPVDGDRLILETLQSISMVNAQQDMTAKFGSELYNRIQITAYPRKVDAAATSVLFSLQAPLFLGIGQTYTFTVSYSDPQNKTSMVSGIEMVAPVASTDYLFNASHDGSGSNLTANLVVNAVYGAGDVIYTLTNTGGVSGYVTKLQARGKGVYIYDSVSYVAQDPASLSINGPYTLMVDMKYQTDFTAIAAFAPELLAIYSIPKLSVEKATYAANRLTEMMDALIYLEPGDRVSIQEDVTGIDRDYYIHALDFTIGVGGVVQYTWTLRDASLDMFNFAVWNTDAWDDGTTWGF